MSTLESLVIPQWYPDCPDSHCNQVAPAFGLASAEGLAGPDRSLGIDQELIQRWQQLCLQLFGAPTGRGSL